MQTTDQIVALRNSITRIVRNATGMHEVLAVPIATAICSELQRSFGGEEVYIPAPERNNRNQMVKDDWQLGASIDTICTRYGISRTTFYRLIGEK
jgi:Mor family transcriptional regulator